MRYYIRARKSAGVSEEGGRVFGSSAEKRAQFEDFQHHRNIMRSLLPFLCLLSVGTKGAWTSDTAMPFMEYLDQNHLVCLKWGFDNLRENITFKLVVNTTGWVGFGFSPNGGMKGSDIIMGGFGPSGIYFSDYHAKGNFMPLVDQQQSYTLLSSNESDGQTIMTVQRSIQSCDHQDFHITAKPIKLIYAYGPTDKISYHQARRGTKEINLLNFMPRTTSTNHSFLSTTVDNSNFSFYENYMIKEMMKTVTCQNKNTSSRLSISWIMNPAGIIPLLLCLAIM